MNHYKKMTTDMTHLRKDTPLFENLEVSMIRPLFLSFTSTLQLSRQFDYFLTAIVDGVFNIWTSSTVCMATIWKNLQPD